MYWAHLAGAVGASADIEGSAEALERAVCGLSDPGVFELQANSQSESHALLLTLLERHVVDWGVRIDEAEDRIWVYLDSAELLDLHRDRMAASGSKAGDRVVYLMPTSVPEALSTHRAAARVDRARRTGLAEITPIGEARHFRAVAMPATEPLPGTGRRFWDAVRSDMQDEVAAGLLLAQPDAV